MLVCIIIRTNYCTCNSENGRNQRAWHLEKEIINDTTSYVQLIHCISQFIFSLLVACPYYLKHTINFACLLSLLSVSIVIIKMNFKFPIGRSLELYIISDKFICGDYRDTYKTRTTGFQSAI